MTSSASMEPPASRGTKRRWSRRTKVLSAVVGSLLAGGGAFAATNWVVGLNSSSSGQGQSAAVTNLTISAVASPSPTNLLYPGGNGDVVVSISNPNPFPVTITAVDLPTDATYATGYSNSSLTTANADCTSTTSDVFWSYSTSTLGSSHGLTTPLTVAAATSAGNGTLLVTFTDDASMGSGAPAACESTYFSMPALTGITATGGAATATSSPTTDSWTS